MFNVNLSVVMFRSGLSKSLLFGSSFWSGLTCFIF